MCDDIVLLRARLCAPPTSQATCPLPRAGAVGRRRRQWCGGGRGQPWRGGACCCHGVACRGTTGAHAREGGACAGHGGTAHGDTAGRHPGGDRTNQASPLTPADFTSLYLILYNILGFGVVLSPKLRRGPRWQTGWRLARWLVYDGPDKESTRHKDPSTTLNQQRLHCISRGASPSPAWEVDANGGSRQTRGHTPYSATVDSRGRNAFFCRGEGFSELIPSISSLAGGCYYKNACSERMPVIPIVIPI